MRLVDDFIFTADCFDHKNLVCVPVRCSYFCCPVVCVELWFWNEAFSPVRLVTRNGHVHCHQQRRPENERLERRNIQPSLVSVLLNCDLRKNKHSFQFCLGDVMANMQCSQRGVFGFYYIFFSTLTVGLPSTHNNHAERNYRCCMGSIGCRNRKRRFPADLLRRQYQFPFAVLVGRH